MKYSPVGRPRSAGRLDLPDNLTPRPRNINGRTVVYWYWTDPRNGQEKSLKCPDDRETAKKRARELNALVAQETADQLVSSLVSAPRRASSVPFNVFAAHYLNHLEAAGKADNTLRSRKSLVNAAIRWFRDRPMHEISDDVPSMAGLLKKYTEQDKKRTAQSLRSCLMDMWKLAYEDGVLNASVHPNPAAITKRPAAKVKRARLTLETFNVILQAAERLAETRGEWLPNSILLALVIGRRREDLALAQFRRGRDWLGLWRAYQEGPENCKAHPYPHVHENHFWVVQKKGGALIQIPLDLRLRAINLSVGEVVERCRSKVASRFLLHHTIPFGNAPLGSPVHKDSISHAFADAVAESGLTWPSKKTPPSFHENRSLSERLYKAQGVDTQALLGHKHSRMTEVYDDPRQAEWIMVK